MKAAGVMVVSLLCVSGCIGRRPKAEIETALLNAFRPEADAKSTRAALVHLAQDPSPARLRAELGTNNLTVFLLTLPENSPLGDTDNYDWSWPEANIAHLAAKLDEELSAVTANDINDLCWHGNMSGVVNGSFVIDMDYGLRARLLFEAKGRHGSLFITRLAVARRDSQQIEHGFMIFERE